MNLKNKNVLITGASSGIGAESAKLFSQQGATVILVARNESKLKRVSNSIKSNNGNSYIIKCDISDTNQVSRMVEESIELFGRIDVLFNNAGTSFTGGILEDDYIDNLNEMINIDLLGTVYCTRAILPFMKQQNSGHIINMCSVVGFKSFVNFSAYSSVMHSITGFTDGLRQELYDTNINVTIVHPALTQTPLLSLSKPEKMPPIFKAMSPIPVKAVAHAILSGLHKKKSKIIVPFQPKLLQLLNSISVDLGDKFVRLLSNKRTNALLGMYNGKLYHDYILETEKHTVNK